VIDSRALRRQDLRDASGCVGRWTAEVEAIGVEVLRELGYNEAAIADLRAREVV